MRGTYEVTGDEVLVVELAVLAMGKDGEVFGQRNQDAEEQRNVGSKKMWETKSEIQDKRPKMVVRLTK
jgi:hypothetical protein